MVNKYLTTYELSDFNFRYIHSGISSSWFELTECLYTVRQLDITEIMKFRLILDGTRSNMQFVFHWWDLFYIYVWIVDIEMPRSFT